MRTVGIVAEFNPFHNGHKYLIDRVKKSDDTVIAAMSGNFVQRGDIAIFDKFERAQAALLNGVDIVIELSVGTSLSSAREFAQSAVNTLCAAGITHLAFGSETGDIGLLTAASKAAYSNDTEQLLVKRLADGMTYAVARENAVRTLYGDEIADVLKNPNDILAIEYLRALPCNITPIAVKRHGSAHDKSGCSSFACAMQIRELILQNADYTCFVPDNAYQIYQSAQTHNLKFAESAVVWTLKGLCADDFSGYDVSEGLHNRIYAAVQRQTVLAQIENEIKTKRYTRARIRRVLLSAALGVKNEPCGYIRVLGFTSKGENALKKAAMPVVTSYKTAKAVGMADIFEKSAKTDDFYALCCDNPENYRGLERQVLKIN